MDPFETHDKRFNHYTIPIVFLEKLHTGMRWAEGPAYFGDHRCLIFSDLPSNRLLRWDEETGAVTTFRSSSNFSNGNTRDRQGRLLTCEHRGRRVTRTEHDGTITIVADQYQGKRLNSPNDIVVKSDGTIWFTDPSYGISAEYEGGSRGEGLLDAGDWAAHKIIRPLTRYGMRACFMETDPITGRRRKRPPRRSMSNRSRRPLFRKRSWRPLPISS
jgi:sugar lactone lactonase YvrE